METSRAVISSCIFRASDEPEPPATLLELVEAATGAPTGLVREKAKKARERTDSDGERQKDPKGEVENGGKREKNFITGQMGGTEKGEGRKEGKGEKRKGKMRGGGIREARRRRANGKEKEVKIWKESKEENEK
ncbi:hypothetical protein Tco_1409326 [Tanacetum coccineum]